MGKVYLAENTEVGRKEAIKVLKPELAKDERFAGRFRREARATSRLYHPNIVALYDAGTLPGGRLFIAMEYVDGAPLENILAEQELGLPADKSLTIVCQLASAVEHAHSRGVVHRDLKPANLMVIERRGQQDQLKVLDFGVAKIISPEYQESMRVSQEGVVFGTPIYMAPEQFYEKSNDPRSDIYAIGCIAFELLTGMPPFTGRVSEIVVAHTDKPPPRPSQFADDISPDLEAVILRCLAKNPKNRYATAGDLLAALVPLHPDYSGGETEDQGVPVPDLSPYDLYQTGRMQIADIVAEVGGHHATARDDCDDAETERHSGPLLVHEGEQHWLVRARLPEEFRLDIENALRDIGRRLVDIDPARGPDFRLTVALSEVRSLDAELERVAAERRVLTKEQHKLEHEAQEKQSQLSFAIRELEDERARGGGGDQDLDYQIAVLQRRVAEVGNENNVVLARLAQQEDEINVRRTRIGESKRAAYGHLGMVVDEMAPQYERELGSLFYHYRELCSTFRP